MLPNGRTINPSLLARVVQCKSTTGGLIYSESHPDRFMQLSATISSCVAKAKNGIPPSYIKTIILKTVDLTQMQ